MLTVKCPKCGARLAVPDDAIGHHATCSDCGDHFLLERGPEPPPMAASDPPSEAGFLGTVLPPEQVCPHCNSPAAGERCDECGGRLTELQASAFTVAARPRPLPAGAVYGNAATCYLCGRRIEKDEPRFRRQVHTAARLAFGCPDDPTAAASASITACAPSAPNARAGRWQRFGLRGIGAAALRRPAASLVAGLKMYSRSNGSRGRMPHFVAQFGRGDGSNGNRQKARDAGALSLRGRSRKLT